MLEYLNGRYLSRDKITISPDDRGFLFSDGLYEVIRTYDGRLFQVQSHIDRLSYGARALRFNKEDFSYLTEVSEELIQRNDLTRGDSLVYIQVTRGVAPRTHYFPPPETPLTVYADATPFVARQADLERGINIILVPDQRWARCDIKTVSLVANVLAHQQARESNAVEAVFVRDGVVLEGTRSNFFAVLEGKVVTPPKTNYILGGITREVVLDLCKNLSIPCKQRPIFESEISQASELMIVGTTAEITPIAQINRQRVGSGKPGPITRFLQKAFREMVSSTS